jgi:protein associated with RNAse G/E
VIDRRSVRVLTRKWPDSPHWEFDAIRLGVDSLGHWVGVPRDTLLSKPDKAFHAWCDHVVLLPHDAWWVATIYGDDEDRPVDFYVDVTTPCVWSADESEVSCVDLDLDVIRDPDGRIWIDDEDEFAEHQVTLGYPREVIENARRGCTEVFDTMVAGLTPFDGVDRQWLARLRAAVR